MQLVLSKGERVITRYLVEYTSTQVTEIDAANEQEAINKALAFPDSEFWVTDNDWRVFNAETGAAASNWDIPEAVDPAA